MFKILNLIKGLKSAKNNWKTTTLGLIALVLTLLVTFSDLIDREQANTLEQIAIKLVDNIEIAYGLVVTAIGVFSGDGSDKDKEIKN